MTDIYIYVYAGALGQLFLAEDMTLGGHVSIKVQGAGSRQALVAQVRELEEEWEDESRTKAACISSTK